MLTKYNCDKIATGHYARNFYDEDRKRYVLMRGIDKKKDQSYFIYNVTQEVLFKILFSLGDLTKTEVREIAETEGFNVAHKKDSEEICFIKNNDYGSFIEKMRPEIVKKGNFIDEKGILKKAAHELLESMHIDDPLLDIAREVEDAALADDYFAERRLYPNVDFYSGIILRAIGIPLDMFTVLFAIGRTAGWIAHWKEVNDDPAQRIGRPRQLYTGNELTKWLPRDER